MSHFDEVVVYEAGQVIFAEGEPSSFLYIVKSGEVGIFKESNGKIVPVSVVGSKDFIGELSMFSDSSRSASAVATERAELLLVKKSDVRKVLKNCPDWVSNIMITISDRLRSTIDVLREHRIVDDLASNKISLSQEQLSKYQKSIEEYRVRRGL